MTQYYSDLLLLLPETFLTIIVNIALLFAVTFSDYNNNQFYNNSYTSKHLIRSASIVKPVLVVEPVIYIALFAIACMVILYINSPCTFALGFNSCIIVDDLSRLMSILICISTCASLSLGLASLKRHGRYEFILILLLSVIGMLVLSKSYSLLTVYICVELQSLSFYMLAAMRSRSEASCEAGLKYFILSAFSSVVLLLGICLIYGATGSDHFNDISLIINALETCNLNLENANISVGLGCILISLLFKLAAAPFHAWVADVYEGSPTAITAFFANVSKIAVICAAMRLLEISHNYAGGLLVMFLTFVSALSLLVGSLSAMRQLKLKRLLAFSGVANVGWFLAALSSGHWQSLVFHLFVYILINIALFSVFIMPIYRTTHHADYVEAHPSFNTQLRKTTQLEDTSSVTDYGASIQTIKYISDLNALYKANPTLGIIIAICMFNLAGIPPLAGFYSKYLIINSMAMSEQYVLLAIGLVAAVLGAFYYIRVINVLYFSADKKIKQKPFSVGMHSINAYNATICVFISLALFIRPDYITFMFN